MQVGAGTIRSMIESGRIQATVVGAGTVRKTYRIPSESLTQIAGLERVPEAEPAKPRAMKIHPAIAKAMGL